MLWSALRAAVVLFLVLATIFLVGYVIGDPARLVVPIGGSIEEYERVRESLGLNDPFLAQFGGFLDGVASGNLGDSYWLRRPAFPAVMERLEATLVLVAAAFSLSAIVGIAVGATAARRRGSVIDRMIQFVNILMASMPNYWVGLMLIMLFAVQLGWVPTSGRSGAASLLLPVITLSLVGIGRIGQTVRAALVDEFDQEYVEMAFNKGLSTSTILRRHIARNAAIPIVTYLGWELTRLLTGAALIIELVFSWPGIGWIAVEAVRHQDFPLIQASVVIIAVLVVAIHAVTDLIYRTIDPRVGRSGVLR